MALLAVRRARRRRAMKNPSSPPDAARSQGRVRTSPAGVSSTGRPRSSAGGSGSRSIRAPAASSASIRWAPPRAAASTPHRPARRRARPCRPRPSSSRPCASASRATSAGDLAQGTSGWRRMVPVAVQGASSSTASNGARGRHSSASATTISASSDSRPRLRTRNSARSGERSIAVTLAPRAASCARLAARRGADVEHPPAPDVPSSRAGRAAAASCTHQAPSS